MSSQVRLSTSGSAVAAVGVVPSPREAAELAQRLLADVPGRWPHVRTAGRVAAELALPLTADERGLLVAAATLHDVGYAQDLQVSGFHPLDGALHLRSRGFAPRLVNLVANHSHAWLQCPPEWVGVLALEFPRESSILPDALVYCDMSSGPEGQRVAHVEDRLADISKRHPGPTLELRLRLIRASVANVHDLLRAQWE